MQNQLLGPLSVLVGSWEGFKGDDIAPSDDRQIENNRFRELMTFEDIGLVENHEQKLFGLRYKTMAWRLDEENSFHEEVGYWLWDAKEKQVMKCFLIPRGVSVIAGGTVEPNAKEFELSAKLGSATYGICSNIFLDKEFQTVQFDLKLTIHDENSFSYFENTQLKMKGRKELFQHKDQNNMKRCLGPI